MPFLPSYPGYLPAWSTTSNLPAWGCHGRLPPLPGGETSLCLQTYLPGSCWSLLGESLVSATCILELPGMPAWSFDYLEHYHSTGGFDSCIHHRTCTCRWATTDFSRRVGLYRFTTCRYMPFTCLFTTHFRYTVISLRYRYHAFGTPLRLPLPAWVQMRFLLPSWRWVLGFWVCLHCLTCLPFYLPAQVPPLLEQITY